MDPKHSHGPDRIDYRETPGDVSEVHAAIQREHPEPTAEVTPIPLWLTGVCGLAILWAGLYLGMFHGGFRRDVFNERLSSPELLFPRAAKGGAVAAAPALTLAQEGKSVYANCQPCHQATGTGIAGQFPPLAKSDWVAGGDKRLVAILLKGLIGPVTVNGMTVNGAMPAWEKTLNDKKIAAVASFVRSSFGNTAPEVSEAKVAAARQEFASKTDNWTIAQLEQIPAEASLPDAAAGAAPAAGAPAAKGTAPAPAAGSSPAPAPTAGAPAPAPAGGAPAPASASAGGPPDPALMAQGKAAYMQICFACHQPTGLGLPMVFPPLAKSPYVNGTPERLVAMILKGNMGPMTIEGKPYNNVMPPQEALLTDDKVAAVATYVRNSFGNSAPAVSKDVVTQTRQKFADRKTSWTQAELDAWKD